jgi:hypothetical protein
VNGSSFSESVACKEIGKMMAGTSECKGQGQRVDEKEQREHGDSGAGISMEGVFTFTKAVGVFCRKTVGASQFKGTTTST